MFQGGMLIRILPTSLLNKLIKIILNSQVFVKIIVDPEDDCSRSINTIFLLEPSLMLTAAKSSLRIVKKSYG